MTEQWKPMPHEHSSLIACSWRVYGDPCDCSGTRWRNYGERPGDALALWALCDWFGRMVVPAAWISNDGLAAVTNEQRTRMHDCVAQSYDRPAYTTPQPAPVAKDVPDDTARVDWLEKHGGMIGINHVSYGDYRLYAGDMFDNLRAVVDAAMRASRREGGGT